MNKLNVISQAIDKALKLGATDADAIIIDSTSLGAEVRLGQVINIERSENLALGLRVLINGQQAMVSTADFSDASLENMIERVIAMAKVTPANPDLALATAEQFVKEVRDLNIYDADEPLAENLIEAAKATEQFALDNKNITNSEGASSGYSANKIYFATSKGFSRTYQSSSSSLSVSVIAGKDENMQTDYAYSQARFGRDLKSPREIGIEAAKYACEKLNPRKINTCELPVIFDRRVARRLLAAFASGINGASISRGTSFLIGELGKEIFNPEINIIDDPFILKGLSSRPFDAEGISGSKLQIIENGVLNHYFLDLQTANKLKMHTTGHAIRGLASAPTPSCTNLYIDAGKLSLAEMMGAIKTGLLVTETYGHGANIVNGDYSQGASGFYIENGEIAYPVSEITIASNLKTMFKQMIAANDLKFENSINSPSLLIKSMTIAGN